MGTRGNILFRYLLILCEFTDVRIVGDFITMHTFPVLSPHFLFSGSAWRWICVESIQLDTLWVIKMQKNIFPSMREVFLCFSFCHSFPHPLFLQHTCSESNLKCLCVLYTIFTEKYMFSAVWKGKGGKPWNLPRVRMYQMVFISVWASNQEKMYFLWIFVLVKLKCINVCLKVCFKSALLWMK